MATVEIGMTNGSLKLLHKENILFIDSQKMENPKNVQKKSSSIKVGMKQKKSISAHK